MDEFFAKKKEEMLQKLQAQGIDFYAAKDFIENKHLVSLDQQRLIKYLNMPTYINPLATGNQNQRQPQQ